MFEQGFPTLADMMGVAEVATPQQTPEQRRHALMQWAALGAVETPNPGKDEVGLEQR